MCLQQFFDIGIGEETAKVGGHAGLCLVNIPNGEADCMKYRRGSEVRRDTTHAIVVNGTRDNGRILEEWAVDGHPVNGCGYRAERAVYWPSTADSRRRILDAQGFSCNA